MALACRWPATRTGTAMLQNVQPILAKTRLHDLAVHVARSRLCLNDPVEIEAEGDGRLAVSGRLHRPILGIIPRRRQTVIGHIGPRAAELLAPLIEAGTPLRLRIVGLTPEHIAPPEVYVSVWGAIRPSFTAPPPLGRPAEPAHSA